VKLTRIITMVQTTEFDPTIGDLYDGLTDPQEIAAMDKEYCLDDPPYYLEGEFRDISVIVLADE
jgi:hypothetical protein